MNYTLPKKNISRGFYTFFKILAIINLVAFIITAASIPIGDYAFERKILPIIIGFLGVILLFNTPIVWLLSVIVVHKYISIPTWYHTLNKWYWLIILIFSLIVYYISFEISHQKWAYSEAEDNAYFFSVICSYALWGVTAIINICLTLHYFRQNKSL